MLTSAKILQIELEPINEEPDFAYLKQLHRIMFGELYDWAGTIRTINMSKLRTAFCPADQIESLAAEIFSRLHSMRYFRDCSREELIAELADIYMTHLIICILFVKVTVVCSGCIFVS